MSPAHPGNTVAVYSRLSVKNQTDELFNEPYEFISTMKHLLKTTEKWFHISPRFHEMQHNASSLWRELNTNDGSSQTFRTIFHA